jgi:hypothetical protein
VGPPERFAVQPYDVSDHVLARFAPGVTALHDTLGAQVDATLLRTVVGEVPVEWLEPGPGAETVEAVRAAYVSYLEARLASPGAWMPKAAAA